MSSTTVIDCVDADESNAVGDPRTSQDGRLIAANYGIGSSNSVRSTLVRLLDDLV